MKVVKPNWLVESLKAGMLLPWQNYVFRVGERMETTQGRKAPQKSLFGNFVTQRKRPTPFAKAASGGDEPEYPMSLDDDDDGGGDDWQDSQVEAGPSQLSPSPSPPETPPKQFGRARKTARTTPSRPLYITDLASPEDAARVPGYAAHKSNPNAERAMKDPAWRAAHTSVAPDFIEGYYKNSRLHHLSAWKAELKNLVAEAQERAENGGADTWKTTATASLEGGGGAGMSASQEAVKTIVRQNLGGRGLRGVGLEGDVSMKGATLVKKAAPGKGKGKEREKAADEEHVIMHCDFDSFFVSAGLVDRPHLRGKPVVVCHSQGSMGGGSSTSEIASASYEARKFGIKGGMRCVAR